MKNRNCPNCGAPIDLETNKCNFCNTSYFDLSCINLENHEPMYLKLKVNMGGKSFCITQKVIPRLEDITMSSDTVDVAGIDGRIRSVVSNNYMTTNLSFEAISDHGNLCQILTEE